MDGVPKLAVVEKGARFQDALYSHRLFLLDHLPPLILPPHPPPLSALGIVARHSSSRLAYMRHFFDER